MEQINNRIKYELEKCSLILSKGKDMDEELNERIIKTKEEFDTFIHTLKMSMRLCKYRQVIKDIKSKKKSFELIPEEHWKLRALEINAIFHVLRKKFFHHSKEISLENSYQNYSFKFWLNRMSYLLEQLGLDFSFDLNKNIDFNNESILKPVRIIIEGYIKFIFCLIIFSQYNHQLQEVCSYISIMDRFVPYFKFMRQSSSYVYFQKIQILKVKLYIENCDYVNAIYELENNVNFCCHQLKILGDDDDVIYYYGKVKISRKSIYERKNFEKDILCFKSSSSSKRSSFFSSRERTSQKNVNDYLRDNKNKENVDIQIWTEKTNPRKKKLIEEIFENLAINFYFRGVFFEQLGNVCSALDSYKVVEWFATIFLSNKFPKFAGFTNSLLNRAWDNYYIITRIKEELENRKNFLEMINQVSKKSLLQCFSRNEKYVSDDNNQKEKNEKLVKYLDNLGEKIYNDEKNRNNMLFNKFTKTKYITSTIKMIEDLLSPDFSKVLGKMKKIEITNPKPEILDLINKISLQKRIEEKERSDKKAIMLLERKRKNFKSPMKISLFKSVNNIKINKEKDLKINKEKDLRIKVSGIFSDEFRKIKNKRYFMIKKEKNRTRNKSIEKEKSLINSLAPSRSSKYKFSRNESLSNLSKKISHKSQTNLYAPKISIIYKPKTNKTYKIKKKIARLEISKENFSRNFLKKKYYLDKLFHKDLHFHKNLLKTKSNDLENLEISKNFDAKKILKDVDKDFFIQFEMAKASLDKKSLNYFFHQNNINKNILSTTIIRTRQIKEDIEKDYYSKIKKEIKDSNNINDINQIKMRELNFDCEKIQNKANTIKKRRRDIILGF